MRKMALFLEFADTKIFRYPGGGVHREVKPFIHSFIYISIACDLAIKTCARFDGHV